MIEKQKKLILIFFAALVLLGAIYFVAKPLLFSQESGEISEFDKDGDRINRNGRPYIYDVIDSENVDTIYVKNTHGEYTMKMDPIAQEFVLKGAEHLLLDGEKLSYLYVNTCNMLAMAKVENPATDLSEYGLEGGVSDNFFTVTSTSGKEYTVYIGDLLPTGAAYYCKYADKEHVYIIDTLIDDCVLISREDYVVPLIAPAIAESGKYNVDNIRVVKNGELTVQLQALGDEGMSKNDAVISHIMTQPASYTPSQVVVDNILTQLCYFVGDGVAEIGVNEENLAEISAKYGFAKPTHELLYTYGGREMRVIFGSKTEDGQRFYVFNSSQNTVCTVPVSQVDFIEYDLLGFIDRYIFQMGIDSIESIYVRTKRNTETFTLSGEMSDLTVTTSKEETIDTKNFRQFYIDLLLIAMDNRATAPEVPSEILAYTVTTRDGRKYEYRFYDLSTRKIYFTVNGEGEFCANRDDVERTVNNLDKLLRGEKIVSVALG